MSALPLLVFDWGQKAQLAQHLPRL